MTDFKEKDDYAGATVVPALAPMRSTGSDDLEKPEPGEMPPAFDAIESGDVAHNLRVTGKDLEEAEEYAKTLSMDEVKGIMERMLKVHENDPNFPLAAVTAAKQFLYDPEVQENPQAHSKLIREVFIEAALIANNSPYAEVRAVVSNKDDPTLPVSTFRAWFIGIVYVAIGAFINQLFSVRQPAIAVGSNVAQLLAYPAGTFLAKVLPDVGFNMFGTRFSLNPGPFNRKEHMLITIMANVGFSTPYTDNIIWSQYLPQYYNQRYAGEFSYQILIGLGTNFVGYGMAGLTRRFLVYPTYAVWPTSLVTIALNNAFHAETNIPVQAPFGRVFTASRMKCFYVCFIGMFVYFWFPNYIFVALSTFNWLSWIAPNNTAFNNIVGMNNGLGYNPWSTFDWNIVTFNGDPLVLPLFNIMNGIVGMVLTGFMIMGLYWTNTWNTAYLPINSNRTFDRYGKRYNISRSIDDRGHFSKEEYEAYSQAYMAAGNITVYFWFFAAYSAVVSYAYLYHRHEIVMGFKNLFRRGKRHDIYDDVHNKLMSVYPEVSEWWYFGVLCFAIICGCCGIGLWETYTTPAVVIYGIILCAVAVVPIGIITSITGLQVTLNVLAEFIGGAWVAGNALAMNYFKSFGYVTCAHALAFSNDLKLAHYVKLPPRHTFVAQLVATFISTFVCTGVLNFQMNKIANVCTPEAAFKMTCPGINTFFTAAVFWGTLGPHKLFGKGGQYVELLIGFPVGFVLPIIFYFAMKKFPNATWLRQVHPIPLIYGGIAWAPYNLSYMLPQLLPSLISMKYLKQRYLGFWAKYNYTISASFSSAIAISGIVMFFALQWPDVVIDWWGNNVPYEGCEGTACTRLIAPKTGFGPAPGEFKG